MSQGLESGTLRAVEYVSEEFEISPGQIVDALEFNLYSVSSERHR